MRRGDSRERIERRPLPTLRTFEGSWAFKIFGIPIFEWIRRETIGTEVPQSEIRRHNENNRSSGSRHWAFAVNVVASIMGSAIYKVIAAAATEFLRQTVA